MRQSRIDAIKKDKEIMKAMSPYYEELYYDRYPGGKADPKKAKEEQEVRIDEFTVRYVWPPVALLTSSRDMAMWGLRMCIDKGVSKYIPIFMSKLCLYDQEVVMANNMWTKETHSVIPILRMLFWWAENNIHVCYGYACRLKKIQHLGIPATEF